MKKANFSKGNYERISVSPNGKLFFVDSSKNNEVLVASTKEMKKLWPLKLKLPEWSLGTSCWMINSKRVLVSLKRNASLMVFEVGRKAPLARVSLGSFDNFSRVLCFLIGKEKTHCICVLEEVKEDPEDSEFDREYFHLLRVDLTSSSNSVYWSRPLDYSGTPLIRSTSCQEYLIISGSYDLTLINERYGNIIKKFRFGACLGVDILRIVSLKCKDFLKMTLWFFCSRETSFWLLLKNTPLK